MKNADAVCLFSKFEGYPMVIEEAKILIVGKYVPRKKRDFIRASICVINLSILFFCFSGLFTNEKLTSSVKFAKSARPIIWLLLDATIISICFSGLYTKFVTPLISP